MILCTSFKYGKSPGLVRNIQKLASLPPQKTELKDDNDKLAWKLDYSSKCIFIGSCFSQNISAKLKRLKFPVLSNPQGILFNPISIEKCLNNIVHNPLSDQHLDIILDKPSQIYHAWDCHSELSSMNKEELITNILTERLEAQTMLTKAKAIFLTLGTSKVYSLLSQNNRVVANCHKRKSISL
jgi:hypothetical protein